MIIANVGQRRGRHALWRSRARILGCAARDDSPAPSLWAAPGGGIDASVSVSLSLKPDLRSCELMPTCNCAAACANPRPSGRSGYVSTMNTAHYSKQGQGLVSVRTDCTSISMHIAPWHKGHDLFALYMACSKRQYKVHS